MPGFTIPDTAPLSWLTFSLRLVHKSRAVWEAATTKGNLLIHHKTEKDLGGVLVLFYSLRKNNKFRSLNFSVMVDTKK